MSRLIVLSFDDFSLSTKPSECVITHWCEHVAMRPKAQISATPTTKLTAKPHTKPTKSSKMNRFAKWNSWRNATMSQVIFSKMYCGKIRLQKRGRLWAQSRTSNRKAWFRYPASLVRRFWEMEPRSSCMNSSVTLPEVFSYISPQLISWR